MIYLNHAASGLMSAATLATVQSHLAREAQIGGMEAAIEAAPRLDAVHRAAARLINARDHEIAFTDSGNRALASLLGGIRLSPGDRVLVAQGEWGGTLAMLAAQGATVEAMPVDADGHVDLPALSRRIDRDVKLVMLTWCPATSGLINPAEAIGALAAQVDALYLIDACQALGQLPVDVQALRCHGLAASGRKWLRGPRGTGILFASDAFIARVNPPMVDQSGGSWQPAQGRFAARPDARRLQMAEFGVAARLGLGTAIDEALAIGIDAIRARIDDRARQLRAGLHAIDGVTVHEAGEALSGIVTFTVQATASADVRARLAARGVAVNTVADFYAPWAMQARGLTDVVRAAPHATTSAEEIDAAIAAVRASVTP